MLGREPYETRFQGGTEIRGFNQIEKFLRHITPQNKLYCFSEKKILGVRCTLKNDDVSMFTQRHFQVKMNKKRLFEYKYTKTNP